MQYDLPELKGGIFNLPTIIGVDFVKTRSELIFFDRGNYNFSRRGQVLKYANSELIVFNKKNAWKDPVSIKGSLEFLAKPLSYNRDSEIFLRDQLRNVRFIKVDETSEEQFQLNILEWDPFNFNNNLGTYDSAIPGCNNLTKFAGYGMLSSLPYFPSCTCI